MSEATQTHGAKPQNLHEYAATMKLNEDYGVRDVYSSETGLQYAKH